MRAHLCLLPAGAGREKRRFARCFSSFWGLCITLMLESNPIAWQFINISLSQVGSLGYLTLLNLNVF